MGYHDNIHPHFITTILQYNSSVDAMLCFNSHSQVVVVSSRSRVMQIHTNLFKSMQTHENPYNSIHIYSNQCTKFKISASLERHAFLFISKPIPKQIKSICFFVFQTKTNQIDLFFCFFCFQN